MIVCKKFLKENAGWSFKGNCCKHFSLQTWLHIVMHNCNEDCDMKYHTKQSKLISIRFKRVWTDQSKMEAFFDEKYSNNFLQKIAGFSLCPEFSNTSYEWKPKHYCIVSCEWLSSLTATRKLHYAKNLCKMSNYNGNKMHASCWLECRLHFHYKTCVPPFLSRKAFVLLYNI